LVSFAGGDSLLLTGRLSLDSHPWLADHVYETALLPGTAFVELALRGGAELGCETLDDLALEAPLLLPEQGCVAIQVQISAPSDEGRRELTIHSRPDSEVEAEWTRHAIGCLSPGRQAPPEVLGAWPPAGAEPLEVGSLYERLEQHEMIYGPAFQCVDSAWRRGEEIFVEVSLLADQAQDARRFGLHPALLDASGHVSFDLATRGELGEGSSGIALPFAWQGVRYYAPPGTTAMRMRIAPGKEGSTIQAFDRSGAPVAAVESVVLRAPEPGRLRAAAEDMPLYRIEWTTLRPKPAPAPPRLAVVGEESLGDVAAERYPDLPALMERIEAGATVPDAVLVDARTAGSGEGDVLGESHAAGLRALALVKAWAAAESLAESRLVFVTEGGACVRAGERPHLAASPVWGLVRSAQSEHPGRFGLLDVDASEATWRSAPTALGHGDEPQLALREGELLVPRLGRLPAGPQASPVERLDPEATVLITGGTSGIGAQLARHLAAERGARQLLLVSRSGEAAHGAAELRAELEGLGASVRVAACDVAQRDGLRDLLESIPRSHPLGMVVHSAAVLEDGVLESQTGESFERVMRPKADAAWHLHELTREIPLSQFVLFSSAAGVLGGAGQANYCAANAFLEALVQHREAMGLPATALAWGLWEQESRLAGDLDGEEAESMMRQIRQRLAIAPMPVARGLELFDSALGRKEPLLLPAELDRTVMRAQARSGSLPAILRGLVRVPRRRGGGDASLGARLAAAPEGAERKQICLDLIRHHAATVVGLERGAEIDPERSFRDLGFDSLGAVELRNQLIAVTGLRLPATLVFDYPTPKSSAEFLLAEAAGEGRVAAAPTQPQRFAGEPIAIVGMACRYPGGVSSPAELWKLVEAGADAISSLPVDRGWDFERLYDPEPGSADTFYVREGGFLPDAADFDAAFFGISPREAESLDPQERLALEASWEALEASGIDPTSLQGTQTGVFAGVMYQDYGRLAGMSSSAISGRVAYSLGLEGPTMSVDTACSSSLVALHLASQALRQGECSLALAGGVTVAATPGMLIFFSNQRGLSPDGRCKAFAEEADGTGLSEGAGVVVLERLSEAEANGHPVLAVIRGSAVNQDGASNGLTAPNGPSQERVIRAALADAGLEPGDVDAVEAHGTGTALGDPIEAGALIATYGRDRKAPVRLGSIKSNIGHAQAAAGVAGVIKMTMAMREGVLPRTLYVERPSSKIDWAAGKVELLSEAIPWEPNGHPRRAGVSSFGASGTNAHLILEEPQRQVSMAAAAEGGEEIGGAALPLSGPLPLALSAKTEPALREAASRLAIHLEANPELSLADIAYSLATTRAAFERRAVALGSSRKQGLEALRALASGETSPDAVAARARSGPLAFLFSGQGSQRAAMGRQLYDGSSVYREALDEACGLLDPELDRPLVELLFAAPGSAEAKLLDRTTYAQPALFATQVSLHRLLTSCGLAPELLAGHSIGEISAAHVAGVLSLPDAARLVAARGRLMGELPEDGAMIAIEAGEGEVAAALSGREDELSIAAVNGPLAVVISGGRPAAEEVASKFVERGARTKRLSVSHAFHSPLIEPMLESFAAVAAELDYREPRLTIVSGLSGGALDPAAAMDPAYWVEHARRPVRFADAIATIVDRGASVCLELGPDPVLLAMAEQCLEDEDERAPALVPTLREDREECHALVHAIAAAQAHGAKLERAAYFAKASVSRVPLPTYPFERKRYWQDGGASADVRAAGQSPTTHPLLGAKIERPGQDLTLTGSLSLATHPWLADHVVAGNVLLPGSAFLDLSLAAGKEAGCETVAELVLQEPLVVPRSGALQLQVSVEAADHRAERQIAIHSCLAGDEEKRWSLHARGVLAADLEGPPSSLESWPPDGAQPLGLDDLYDRLADAGVEYGPSFRGLEAAWGRGEQIYAEVSLPRQQVQAAERFALHPVLLDCAGHVAIGARLAGGEEELSLPFAWSGVTLRSPGASSMRVRIDGHSLAAFDESGAPLLRIDSLSTRPIDLARIKASAGRRPVYKLRWQAAPPVVAARQSTQAKVWRWLSQGTGVDAAVGALAAIHAHLAEDRPERLAILTDDGVRARDGEDVDPAAAAVWGLVRSAQSEHPDRFVLIDGKGTEVDEDLLSAALGREGESQLAVRDGELLVPRLERFETTADEPSRRLEPERSVLITGATGALGALLARHLVEEHGARNLLLLSRSGGESPVAARLGTVLTELGAEPSFLACDVADREALAAILAGISAERPLGAVFHCAGIVDDGVIDSLDRGRIEGVFGAKADAARHLHELTRESELSHFVLFSSAAGLLGTPGQANYAAANAFCDGLAAHRHAQGLPATSLTWGPWARSGGMGDDLDAADRARLRRLGLVALESEEGLELLDVALASEEPLLAPIAFDPGALRVLARAGSLAPPLRGLVHLSALEAPSGPSLAQRLAAAAPAEREPVVLDFVRANVGAVLGHASGEEIEPTRAFNELGFDSLAAVELRNRLGAAAGVRLPPTLVFDYPTAEAVTAYLLKEIDPEAGEDPADAAEREMGEILSRLDRALGGLDGDERVRARLDARLRSFLLDLSAPPAAADELDEEGLASMSQEEMFKLIDRELGSA
jgi:acyl transferase domain-containing protein/acyl carrier protein